MPQMTFTQVGNTPEFAQAAQEYKKIWERDGEKIVHAFKEVTGLEFKQSRIDAVIYEGMSRAGGLKYPMKLRASYTHSIKIGTLIHELSHRLLYGNRFVNEVDGLDEEEQKNLFLYDVWVDLYGRDFAEKNVEEESKRKGFYDYEKAWRWALKKSRKQRENRFKKLVKNREPSA